MIESGSKGGIHLISNDVSLVLLVDKFNGGPTGAIKRTLMMHS